MGTPPTPPVDDPKVIEQFAEKLYRKASSFVAGSVVIGAALGAPVGAVPQNARGEAGPNQADHGLATQVLGGRLGAGIGEVIGETRTIG